MNSKKVVQCSLKSDNISLVAWLDVRPDLQKGVWVTLKDHEEPERRWLVTSVGKTVLEKSSIPRHGAFFDSDI